MRFFTGLSAVDTHRTFSLLDWLAMALMALFGLFYAYYVNSLAVDYPFQDDNSLLRFLYEIRRGLSPGATLELLFSSENDHRIVIPRLIAYADYRLTGHIHFRAYILLANVGLVAMLYGLYRLFRQLNVPVYLFLPVPLFVLQPQYHEVSVWSISGIQHILPTLLALMCVLLLYRLRSNTRFALAIGLAVMATFTQGHGILAFAAGAYLLLLEQRYKRLAVWIVPMLACLAVYLLGYTPGSQAGQVFHLNYALGSLFIFFGGAMAAFPLLQISGSIVLGALLCLLLWPPLLKALFQSFGANRQAPQPRHVLFAFFGFISLAAIIIAGFRSGGKFLLASRFQLYTALSLAIAYLYLLDQFRQNRVALIRIFAVTALGAVLFCGSSFYQYTSELAYKKSRYMADSYNWRARYKTLFSTRVSRYFLIPAYEQGYWHIPDYFPGLNALVNNELARKRQKPGEFPMASFAVHQIIGGAQPWEFNLTSLVVRNTDSPLTINGLNDELFLLLHSEATNQTYLVGTNPQVVARRRLFTDPYFAPGFQAILPVIGFEPGTYRLGTLLKKADGQLTLYLTRQQLTIRGGVPWFMLDNVPVPGV